MAGRHRRTSRHRGRHRKPLSPARIVVPAASVVAVAVASVIVLTHDGGHPSPIAPVAATDPHSSVLAFHTARSEPTASSATTPRPHRVDRPTPSRQAPAHHHPAASHQRPTTLRLRATADCYVQVTARNGHLLVRSILHRHDQLTFRQHGLEVVLGNAGGARIALDGHHSQVAGRSGQVRRFHVG